MTPKEIQNELLDIFRGMMSGNISYSFDTLDTVMSSDIGEVFDSAVGFFVMKVESDENITSEDMDVLLQNLETFAEEYDVEEALCLAQRIKGVNP